MHGPWGARAAAAAAAAAGAARRERLDWWARLATPSRECRSAERRSLPAARPAGALVGCAHPAGVGAGGSLFIAAS